MAYEQEAKDLSELSANRISFTGNAKTGDRELIRGWKSVADTRKATILDYLNTIVTVTDPMIDKVKQPGLWRVVSNGWAPQYQGYVQVLREGWATTLSWPEVRIAQGEDRDTADGHRALHMLISMPNVAAGSEQAIAAALMAGSPWTNPTIQGVQRAGIFYCLYATPQMVERDGSYVVQAILSQGHGVFTGYADNDTTESEQIVQLLHVPSAIVQALANNAAYKQTGASLSSNYNQAENTWTLTVRQPQLTAFESDEQLIYEDVFETRREKQYFNQLSVPSLGTFTTGILKLLSSTLDKFKRWRVELRTITSKYSLIEFQVITHPASTGIPAVIEYHKICRNQRGSVPTFPAIAAGYLADFTGSPSRNPDGTWNWYVIHKLDEQLLADAGEGVYYNVNRIWQSRYDKVNEHWQRECADQISAVRCKMCTSAAQAWAYTYSGVPISAMPRYMGPSRWLAQVHYSFTTVWIDMGTI